MSGRYGDGSIYQRKSDGRYVGAIEAGWTERGTRRRLVVTGKTRAEVARKIRDKRRQISTEGMPTSARRLTVKAWAEVWLAVKVTTLTPKAYNAAASPVRRWIIPTIGHKRLDLLTPGDVRAVERAQRQAGRKGTTAAATQRTLLNMLRAAEADGHTIPARVLKVKAPKTVNSDRTAPTPEETWRLLKAAADLPHGTRWLFGLLHGARQGEALGLTWDAVDLDLGVAVIEWQLQPLPYLDRAHKDKGFRVPDDYEARHLIDSYHLVRPKSRKGHRLAPLTPAEVTALADWKAVAPPNPWGLVWTREGRPINDKHDRTEWQELQDKAGVRHPSGRYFHVHETRNYAATELREVGADDNTTTSLLGHTSAKTSSGYMADRLESMRAAVVSIEARIVPSA